MSDTIASLKHLKEWAKDDLCHAIDHVITDAEEEITQLREENARLRACFKLKEEALMVTTLMELQEENERHKAQAKAAVRDWEKLKHDCRIMVAQISDMKAVVDAATKLRTHFARNAKPRLNSDDVVAILALNEALKALDVGRGAV